MVPRVSVVMPVRNAGATFAPAVKSVLMQTMREFELIIVDDGGGLRRLIPSALQDNRIKIISLPPTGIVGALNAGIEVAVAPYIARMDADDVCSPRRLELQLAHMEDNPDCALLGSRVRKFPRRALKEGMLHYERWLNSVVSPEEINRDLFVESPFAHPSVMFRRADFLSLGGYRDMGWPEDYDLWLRFARAEKGMTKLVETLIFWRDTEDRLSRRSGVYSAEKFREVKAHFLKEWRLKDVSGVQVWGSGPDGKTWAKLLIKSGFHVLQFIDIDKKKVGGHACGGESGGGIPVVWPGDILKGVPVLCAVGIKGAREQIRDYLTLEGFSEPDEFMFLS
jgi:glycosyltransferase involved in cell wall biosynthesis